MQFQNDIAGATSVVNSQLSRLRMLDKKFAAMDKDFRYKIAQSIKSGNNSRAKALANEYQIFVGCEILHRTLA